MEKYLPTNPTSRFCLSDRIPVYMKELIDSIQHDLVNGLRNEKGYFEESQIDNLVVDLMSRFIKKMF
ncbi:hypothetical protein Hanom_Chr02g00168701 [Helianthus anomalus]